MFTGTFDAHSTKVSIKINLWTQSHGIIASAVPHFNDGLPLFTLHLNFG